MDEREFREMAVHLESVDNRCQSNTHRIDCHDNEIKELHQKQDAIYELTSSVKSIATDLSYMKNDLQEVKTGQKALNDKVTEIENRPANETKKTIDELKSKITWLIVGGVVAGLLATILPNIHW